MCPTKTGFRLWNGSNEVLFSLWDKILFNKILRSIINVNHAPAVTRATRAPLFPVLHYLRVNLFTPAVAMATSSGRWNWIALCLSCVLWNCYFLSGFPATALGRWLWEAVQPFCCVVKPKGEAVLTSQPWGFPGGTVVKNLPANAADTGSSPRSRKIPHAAEQLSPCATAEPALWSPWATTTEPACHNYWSPHA